MAVEVPANGEDDDGPVTVSCDRDKMLDEAGSLVLVLTGCEGLLELVDDEDEPPLAGDGAVQSSFQLAERMLSRPDHERTPALATRQQTRFQ